MLCYLMKCAQTQNQIIHVSYHVGRGHLDGGELGDEEVDHADVGVGDVAALPLGPGGRVVLEGVLGGADQVLNSLSNHTANDALTLDRLNPSSFLK